MGTGHGVSLEKNNRKKGEMTFIDLKGSFQFPYMQVARAIGHLFDNRNQCNVRESRVDWGVPGTRVHWVNQILGLGVFIVAHVMDYKGTSKGNIISFGLFLSPVPTFIQIWKKRSVEQFSPVPYLATLLQCMLWVVYGMPLVHPHSVLVITINGSGCAIELFYVVLFLIYSDGRKRMKVLGMLVLEIAFVALVFVLVLTLAHTHERRSLIVGVLCVVFGTMMYVAPLSVMKLVIKTKSVEFMPLSLSIASFANGLCWTTYALIRFDLFITIPNGLGSLFAIAQLVLYATFYKSTKRQIAERKANGGMTAVVVMGDGRKVGNGPPLYNSRAAEISGDT